MRIRNHTLLLSLTAVLVWNAAAGAVRIKDIAAIKGVRTNQLVGYGLVVGLEGTGDGNKSLFTVRAIAAMMEKMGMTVNPAEIKVKNTAGVMVTADLPPFGRAGGRIDATVSSMGDAKSLQGGTLIFTPLKGADGRVYAVAQGPVSIGGFSAGGAGGGVQKNFLTVGRVPEGALIEREVAPDFAKQARLTFILKQPDFTTALRVADAINAALSDRIAGAPDPGTVHVAVPEQYRGDEVRFVTLLEALDVSPDTAARVVINERTGTVVMGRDVRISTVAIAHGNLSVQIRESAAVSQPPPFSDGVTVVAPETDVAVQEESRRLMTLDTGATIDQLVRALNALGVTPRDLIAILQAIKAAGALQAELEII